MVARINTVAFHGVDVQNVDVQVQISTGLPAFTIVGSIKPIIAIFLISFFLAGPAYAWSCISVVPTAQQIIDAPVIFSGIAIETGEKELQTAANGMRSYKYIRFKVTRMFKGQNTKYLDLLVVAPGYYTPKIGEEVTLIPDTGMSISGCSLGMRTEQYWAGKVRKAYATPIPNLYLKIDAIPYKVEGFVFLSLLSLIFALIRKKYRNRGLTEQT